MKKEKTKVVDNWEDSKKLKEDFLKAVSQVLKTFNPKGLINKKS
jgi:hypothetical protein